MKTTIKILCAVMALAACSNDPETDITATPTPATTSTTEATPVTFSLTATHPDDAATTRSDGGGSWQWLSWSDDETVTIPTATTRAVKTGWEAGDAIFVFFSNVAAPKHLKMTYDGSAWTYTEMGGEEHRIPEGGYSYDEAVPGSLGLTNGMTGTMRAVFLPYGSDETVRTSNEAAYGNINFEFVNKHYSYYLTATLPYTVVDNTVSGAFNMQIPEGFVQFFVPDANAATVTATMGCDAICNTYIRSICFDNSGNLIIMEATTTDDMPGHYYNGGYQFSGKINTEYKYGGTFYFAVDRPDYDKYSRRKDSFVSGKTLASHNAVILPKLNGWYNPSSVGGVVITNDVRLRKDESLGYKPGDPGFRQYFDTYETISIDDTNYGADYPEDDGYHDFVQYGGMNKLAFNYLKGYPHTLTSVHGREGYVFVFSKDRHIFLPTGTYYVHDSTNEYGYSITSDFHPVYGGFFGDPLIRHCTYHWFDPDHIFGEDDIPL